MKTFPTGFQSFSDKAQKMFADASDIFSGLDVRETLLEFEHPRSNV